jgi:REP-associated tyrosine transposase
MNWWNGITKEDEELEKDQFSFQITSEMKRLWCPIIWTTDRQQCVLHPGLRKKLFPYMTEYCAYKDIKLECLNGYAEHVHCLFPYTLDTDLANMGVLIMNNEQGIMNFEGKPRTCFYFIFQYSLFDIRYCFKLFRTSTFSNFQITKFSNCFEGDEDFLWNRNFIALSVGQSSIEALRTYIKEQEVIHKKKTYRQEFTEIVEKYGFKR